MIPPRPISGLRHKRICTPMPLSPSHRPENPVHLERVRLDAEKSVLAFQFAGCRLNPAIDRLKLFDEPRHRIIQAAIDDLAQEGRATDIFSIAEHVESISPGSSQSLLAYMR